jgi:aminopeptidase-like protein
MLPDDIVKAVKDNISGIRAKDFASAISMFHRIQASPGFSESIEYLKTAIASISDAKVKVFEYPADGKIAIGTWENPFSWEGKEGKLELLEPERKILADFSAEPISLVAHSTPTEIESEVVYVGKGLSDVDYKGKDVKGKLVLTESLARLAHKVACIKHGAAGILTFVPPEGIDELAELRRYDAIWPDADDKDKTKFGFALKQGDGVKIKQWLQEGKTVRVKARVDAILGPGKLQVLSALLPGTEKAKEVWLAAHVCHPHPGANDNASGSGALLEILRVLTQLIGEGKIPQPEYSIRFLWIPEWSGTIQFIHHEQDILKRCMAMINLDMVGADPTKSGSVLHLYRTPFSLPSTLNNVVRYWLKTEAKQKDDRREGGSVTPLPYQYSRYSAGSDHFMLTDSTVGIPAVMLNQYPDRFYHTSTDTVDKLDTRQMSYASRIGALSALSLVLPRHVYEETVLTECRNEFVELMQEVSLRGVTELSRCLGDPEKIYPRVLRWLGLAHDLGQETLERATSEWSLIEEQEALRQSLKTSLQMVYTTEMVVARKAYEGACAEVGLEAMQEEQISLDTISFGLEVKRIHDHAMSPGYVVAKLGDKGPEYMQMRKENDRIFESMDEMLNMSKDWTLLDAVWDMICFQFKEIESSKMLKIVKDLTEAGIIESRSV